jgi:hypothetical protein
MGEKIVGINLQSHFSSWSKFGNLGPKNHLKSFKAILRHPTTLLWAKPYYGDTIHILHTETFPTMQESPQLEFVWESYASCKLT